MKVMKTKIFFSLLLLLGGWGCYEDKGNYDYKEVNEVSFSISPASNSGDGYYIYRQPAADTMKITYSVEVAQSMKEKEDNLNFRWIVSHQVAGRMVNDTVDQRELTLAYPPKQTTKYSVLFRVTDEEDHISWYTTLNMSTRLPFMRALLVLHGDPGERRIGAIEDPDSSASRTITYDAYKEMVGVTNFANAEHLFYIAQNGGPNHYNIATWEQLIVTGSDSLYYLYPYNFMIRKKYEDIIPNLDAPKIIGGFADNVTPYVLLMDEYHKLYHSGGEGLFFDMKAPTELADYEADKIYTSIDAYTTVWDEKNRKLMYYFTGGNYYNAGASLSNRSSLIEAPFRTTITREDGTLQDREIVWLGKRVNTGEGMEGATLLVKDTVFTFYQINYNVKDEPVKVDSVIVKSMDINRRTCFATSLAFANQIFYTNENGVYLLNLISGETRLLYEAGAPVSKLQFRVVNRMDPSLDKDENFKLSVVVNHNGKGELHELRLSGAGDVIDAFVHTGFEPIQDVCYTVVCWDMFDEV